MSRYIDVDALIEILKAKSKTDYEMGLYNHGALTDSFIRFVGSYPPADVVEVVRCKDCKHNPENGGECDRSITHTGRDYVCEVNTYRYIGIDYCSYGERREENER